MAIKVEKIDKSLRKVRKFTAKLPKNPSPNTIHKLRTNARKLEAIFDALLLDSRKNERQLTKTLRRIRKRAGKVRDLDVLTGDLATVHVHGETDCQVQLIEYLGNKRRNKAANLDKFVRENRAELKSRLRKASARLNEALRNAEPHVASLAASESLRLTSQLDVPKRFNRGNLHPYRLKVKQLRYVLELAPDQTKFTDDLSEAKDAIGDWHDWEELVGVASDVLSHGKNCKLLRKLKETADSKFEHAVQVAETLRRNYLKSSSESRKTPHRVELSPAAVRASVALSEGARRAA